MQEFDSLAGFLEHIALAMDGDTEAEKGEVTLMTLHAAKGMEFPVVFLPGWEDGAFPNMRAMTESGDKGLEEERRLAYVGITRARQELYILYVGSRFLHGQWNYSRPSRFVEELPEDLLDIDDISGASMFAGSLSAEGRSGGLGSLYGGGASGAPLAGVAPTSGPPPASCSPDPSSPPLRTRPAPARPRATAARSARWARCRRAAAGAETAAEPNRAPPSGALPKKAPRRAASGAARGQASARAHLLAAPRAPSPILRGRPAQGS